MKARLKRILLTPERSFLVKSFLYPEFDSFWHFHPELEIVLIAKGKGKRCIGDNYEDFKEGDLFFIGSYLPHFWQADDDHKFKANSVGIQFHENFLGEEFFKRPEMQKLSQLFENAKRGIRLLGKTREAIRKEMMRMVNADALDKILAVLSILKRIAGSNEFDYVSSQGFSPDLSNNELDKLNRVCNYVFTDYDKALSIAHAAKLLNMSISAFSHYFKRRTGMNFTRFINEVRISQACKLLIESDLSVSEICYECGFNNLSYFNRKFFEYKNSSPRQYKRQLLKI